MSSLRFLLARAHAALNAAAPSLLSRAKPLHAVSPFDAGRLYSSKKNKKQKQSDDADAQAGDAEPFDLEPWQKKSATVLDRLTADLATLRLGRANPAVLHNVTIPHKNRTVNLTQIADVKLKDPQTLLVLPHDEELLSAIAKAIRASQLGLNPIEEDKALKVPIPRLTQDARDQLTKQCKDYGEKAKSAARAVRHDARESLRKRGASVSGDETRRAEKAIDDLANKVAKDVDAVVKAKIATL
ncbi:ribosome recycling factor [Gonapodya prolifera JEL478]|uniref:Ribosome recycling factor n=1 Tax=Gonapodya prolifera (strain JEL478) TaxID=1344416 RepID=A0A139AZI1_GONPJ|nr:ribosome recycling factor [Gonapodya prolifera JEL478]|eukprot:KXS22141.1 ribosome recycling factor [Gonapodya prolifera JEL478]